MQVETITSGNKKNVRVQSFGSIHPVRYFIKCENGEYVQIKSPKVIKTVQRKLVTWLNKLHNETKNIMSGKTPKTRKSESELDKSLRERLVRFFVNHDWDYRQNKVVRSFYHSEKQGETIPYILTGHTTGYIDDAAKSIERKSSDIKDKAGIISEYYGIPLDEAKRFIPQSDNAELSKVKKNYCKKIAEVIKNILRQKNPSDKTLNAYFIPHIKGKDIKYELTNATFDK